MERKASPWDYIALYILLCDIIEEPNVVDLNGIYQSSDDTHILQSSKPSAFCRSWLIGFYPQGPMKGIFVSSNSHVSSPTLILSDLGDPLGGP